MCRTVPLSLFALVVFLIPAGDAPAAKKGDDKKLPPGLKISVEVPKKAPTLEEVNTGTPVATLTLKNTGKKDLTLWPSLSAQVLDVKGKAVKLNMRIGRFGLTRTPSVLEGIDFLTLKPGKTHGIKVTLSRYFHDPQAILGWELPAAGQYRLILSYLYDRKAVKKQLGKGCKDIDKPNKPWNLAAEVNKKVELKITVAK
jgi:hypothetical protein